MLHARRGERAPLPTAFRRWVPSPRTLASLVGGIDLRSRNPRRTRHSHDAPLVVLAWLIRTLVKTDSN